jgi:hypothetical protein
VDMAITRLDVGRQPAHDGVAHRVFNFLNLTGQSEHQPRCGGVRPDHVADRRFADPAVWFQIRFRRSIVRTIQWRNDMHRARGCEALKGGVPLRLMLDD